MKHKTLFLILLFLSTSLPAAASQTVSIDTPNPCVLVQELSGNKIYLKSSETPCIDAASQRPVTLDDAVKIVEIYVDGRFWKKQTLGNALDLEGLANKIHQIDGLSKQMVIPDNVAAERAAQAAGQTYQYYRSSEYQMKLQAEKQRLMSDMFQQPLKDYYNDLKPQNAVGSLLPTERIYIFISSSVPLETIRNYAAALDKVADPNIVLVMKGFIGDPKHVTPTIKFASSIILKDPNCDITSGKCATYRANLEIDPLLFRRHQITQVPAFVYAPHVTTLLPETSEGSASGATTGNIYTLYGDVSVDYALEQFEAATHSNSITALLAKLRRGFYQASEK